MKRVKKQAVSIEIDDLDTLVRGQAKLRCPNMIPCNATLVGMHLSEDSEQVLLLYEYEYDDREWPEFVRAPDEIDAYVQRL